MPPVPPLITSTVAIDRNGNGWIYEPGGVAHDIGLMPLGSTNPGTTAPANPQLGWLWWDSGVNELKVWNGTTWMASAGGGSGGIAEPTTAGNFLRTNTSTWVAGLPLTGGALTGPLTAPSMTGPTTVTRPAGTGAVLTAQNASAWNAANPGPLFLVNNTAANLVTTQTTFALVSNSGNIWGDNISLLELRHTGGGAPSHLKMSGFGNNGLVRVRGQRNSVDRWHLELCDATVEGGGNTGGNFRIRRCNDAGGAIDTSLNINRATGAVTIPNLILSALPTADPGIPGAVWNNGGVLNISP